MDELDDPGSTRRKNLWYLYNGRGIVHKSGEVLGRGRGFRTGDVIGCHVDVARGVMYFRRDRRRIRKSPDPDFLPVLVEWS